MNREEAQFILRAYRANGEDAGDPQFQEALALVGKDPEFARWFAEELALDASVANKLRSVTVPPDLKSKLLLARKTVQPVRWWNKASWVSAAAAIALLLAVAGVLLLGRKDAGDFAQFRRAMAQASLDMSQHVDVMGLDADQLKSWIIEHRGEPDFVLPAGLVDKRIMGCKVLAWHGHRITLLCFKFSGKHCDVFVVNETALPRLALGSNAQFSSDAGMNTAAWRRDGKIYLMAGNLSQPDLEQLF